MNEKWLEEKHKEMIDFTASLVKVHSANSNETEVAQLIKEKLKEYGVDSKLIGKDKKRQSIIAEIGNGERSILLNGHLDTVPFGDFKKWKHHPLSGKVVDNKLYGRGSMDMKSGVVSLLYAALSLKDSIKGKIILAFTADEESGFHAGIREVLDYGIRADAAIVGEPMRDNKLTIGSRGIYRFKINTVGQSAHTGSTSKFGINAVIKMAKIVTILENLKPRYKEHNLCPPPKVTPATISGGTAINVVPDSCESLVDCRLSLGQTDKTIREDMDNAIKNLGDNELSYNIEELAYTQPYVTDENEDIVRIAVESIKSVMNVDARLVVSGPMTDGNIVYSKGMPLVILGPSGENVHSEDEYVDTDSILRSSKIHALMIEKFLNKS